jgi:preprotein translocase subunit SecD
MKLILLALSVLPSLATAEYLEIRKVVPRAPGAEIVKIPRSGEELALSPDLIVSEKHVASATLVPVRNNEPATYHAVDVVLTEEGGTRMKEATKNAPADNLRLAILIDGKVVTAPVVRSGPLGRNFEISLSSAEEAQAVAKQLQPKKK